MNVEIPYGAQWEEYKKRRNYFWLALITYVPGVLALGFPVSYAFHIDAPFYILAGLWMLVLAVAANYWMQWKCPRCGKPFFRTWWYQNNFARKCVHCGLPKWAKSNPDAPNLNKQ